MSTSDDPGIGVLRWGGAMPRFKPTEYGAPFLAMDLHRQVQPGTFEYALQHLIEDEIDVSALEARS